jgi:beta-lactamase class A
VPSPVETPAQPEAIPTAGLQPEPNVVDPELQELIDVILGSSRTSYGVYVRSLADGTGASVNPDKAFHAASLAKLYIMWEAFREESLGLISFNDTMEVTPYYKTFELGTNAVDIGDVVTVDQALHLMTSVSDTPTAVLLQDTLGVANVNAALEALGIRNSGLFYPGIPVATARDVGVLLEALATGGTLPEESHAAMVALLASARTDNGLRAGVPAEVSVAHKTGTLSVALHDAGIVYLPGRPYIIVVLWDRQAGDDLIETISRRVYEFFEAQD